MEIEQGITTQRLRLLRIVAGLLLAVVFVSAAPFSSACRLWVREYVFSVLTRAEAAAQNLVIAQAAVLARRRGLRFDAAQMFAATAKPGDDMTPVDVALPTLVALRRRLITLRRVLRNLRRHGQRLLRRMGTGRPRRQVPVCTGEALPLPIWRPALTPPERPPDRAGVFP